MVKVKARRVNVTRLDKGLVAGFLEDMKVQNEVQIEDILFTAKQAAKSGEKILLDYFGNLSSVGKKELAGLVTEADLKSERAVVETIKAQFPDHEILGEEGAFLAQKSGFEPSPAGTHRWVIDPLDGTTNYVHGFPIFCVSIGYEVGGDTQMGLISVPMLNQVFWAVKGQGAFLNGKPIQVSQRHVLEEALLATGFFSENKQALKEQLEIFNHFVGQARGVRRSGSAAYDLCMVASGVFDVFWEKNLSPWDTSAGALLVQEAGGIVTSYNNQDYNPYLNSILAANNELHKIIQPELETLIEKELMKTCD